MNKSYITKNGKRACYDYETSKKYNQKCTIVTVKLTPEYSDVATYLDQKSQELGISRAKYIKTLIMQDYAKNSQS